MNAPLDISRHPSVCPHDCPSVCALDVEVIGGNASGAAGALSAGRGDRCARYSARPSRRRPLACRDGLRRHGRVWPYFYAGTMGLVMRDGIDRLIHAKRYSRFFGNICVGIAWPGYIAGTGRMSGISPAEMTKSEVVVIWGTTRKEHGAKIGLSLPFAFIRCTSQCGGDPGQFDDACDARSSVITPAMARGNPGVVTTDR